MGAAIRDITIEQGATFSETYTYPADLTGYVCRSQVRDRAGVKVAEFTITITPGVLTSQIVRTLSATDSSAIPSTSRGLVHDMELEAMDGKVIRLLKGTVTLDTEVTK